MAGDEVALLRYPDISGRRDPFAARCWRRLLRIHKGVGFDTAKTEAYTPPTALPGWLTEKVLAYESGGADVIS